MQNNEKYDVQLYKQQFKCKYLMNTLVFSLEITAKLKKKKECIKCNHKKNNSTILN